MGITRFAQNELTRLSYEIDGPDTANVAVLLHATLVDRGSLGPLRDVLVQRMRVVLPDARGHGGSTALKDRSLTVTDLANDLFAVLEAASLLDPAISLHLVGQGQGAVTALELARRRPDVVASLTLIDPDALGVIVGEPDPEIAMALDSARAANREAAEAAYKGLADRALTLYLDRRWGEGWAQRLARPRQAAIRRNVLALSASLDALDGYRLSAEEAAGIWTPARVVSAATAPLAERTVATRLGTWLPRGRTVFVAELPGGAPFSGAGEAAIGLIDDWLREQRSAPVPE
jgi:pimeloyl-ACP methyl ester carboxylesterase